MTTATTRPAPRPYADATEWLGIAGKTVVITGAASGIGFACVQAFAALGASVVGLDQSPAPSGNPVDGVDWHTVDIRDRDRLQAIADALAAEGRVPDIVVANAGTIVRKPILEQSTEDEERIVDVNFHGTLRTLRAFAPSMQAKGGGRMVVTSSTTAIHALRDRAVYAATKAALSALVRAAALEWGPSGLSVNAVGPGIIRTQLTDAYARANPERAQAAHDNVPLRRMGAPEDVADAVIYLASPAAGFITGHTLNVDGGMTVGSTWW